MKNNASEVLKKIQTQSSRQRFLQSWDGEKKVLSFGCGDDTNAVTVRSDGSVEEVQGIGRPTKLRTATVETFLEGEDVPNRLPEVDKVLRDYLHFEDERIYSLVAVWSVGTYSYSMFSHWGYLFLHSAKKRCGKTRTEEILSHLVFEPTGPTNAPTPAVLREIAAEGGTAILDTLERWRQKGGRII